MSVKSVFARRPLLVLLVLLSVSFRVSTRAASVTLVWDPCASSAVAGYEIYYGLASGEYDWSVNAGDSTNATVAGLTPGLTYYFAVVAYDAYDNVSPFSEELVDTMALPPVVTEQPVNTTVIAGAPAAFNVSAASAAPATYQWFQGGTAAGPVQTYSYFQLWNVGNSNAGNYSVVISNYAGCVTSSVATLTVQPSTQTLSASLQLEISTSTGAIPSASVSQSPPQVVQLQCTGRPGGTYVLLATTNLALPNGWQPVATNVADDYGNWTFTDTHAMSTPSRFFRSMLVSTVPASSASQTVIANPVLNARLSPGQGVQLQGAGTPGSAYVLLAATNLAPPVNWQPVVTNFAGAMGLWTYLDATALTTPSRFFSLALASAAQTASLSQSVNNNLSLSASLSPGQGVQLQLSGVPGSTYVLLATTNLAPPVNWQPVVTNTAGAGGLWTFVDTNAPNTPARFFRAAPL